MREEGVDDVESIGVDPLDERFGAFDEIMILIVDEIMILIVVDEIMILG